MTTKERVIRESIDRAESERNQIKELLGRSPLVEIIELEINTIEQCKQLRLQGQIEHSHKVLNTAIRKKAQLLYIAQQQQDSVRLLERLANLEVEIANLRQELYWIERQNERRASYPN